MTQMAVSFLMRNPGQCLLYLSDPVLMASTQTVAHKAGDWQAGWHADCGMLCHAETVFDSTEEKHTLKAKHNSQS